MTLGLGYMTKSYPVILSAGIEATSLSESIHEHCNDHFRYPTAVLRWDTPKGSDHVCLTYGRPQEPAQGQGHSGVQ